MVKLLLKANKVWNIDGKEQELGRISIFGRHPRLSQGFKRS